MAKIVVTKGEMLMDLVDSLIEMDDDCVLEVVNSVFVDSPYRFSAVDTMFEREVDIASAVRKLRGFNPCR